MIFFLLQQKAEDLPVRGGGLALADRVCLHVYPQHTAVRPSNKQLRKDGKKIILKKEDGICLIAGGETYQTPRGAVPRKARAAQAHVKRKLGAHRRQEMPDPVGNKKKEEDEGEEE